MNMKMIVEYGLKLFIITAVSVGLVAGVNTVTEPIIAQKKIEADNEARMSLVPDAAEFKKVEADLPEGIIEVYEGVDAKGNTAGYTIKTITAGYGGNIEVTTGITKDGVINGINLGSMSETPGLGAKAADEPFYGQYAGKSGELVVSKNPTNENEIEAIAGATITSDAVNKGVMNALSYFEDQLK